MNYDFKTEFYRGDSLSMTFEFERDGAALDVSGLTATLAAGTLEITGTATGNTVAFSVSPEESATLGAGSVPAWVELAGAGEKTTVSGLFLVKEGRPDHA